MSKTDDRQGKTVFNIEQMKLVCGDLEKIVTALQSALEKSADLAEKFDSDYIGEAHDEVNNFLLSLPTHIWRLILLYNKIRIFIFITEESFLDSDAKMVQRMEN